MSSNSGIQYGFQGFSKGLCEDCGFYSPRLSTYDDSFPLEDGRTIEHGYYHGWKICKKCTQKHDFSNDQLRIELAKEREEIERSRWEEQ